jgi:hypothetical protein
VIEVSCLLITFIPYNYIQYNVIFCVGPKVLSRKCVDGCSFFCYFIFGLTGEIFLWSPGECEFN